MATRFYFPASEAAAVSPAIDAVWDYTSEFVRRRLVHVKGSSAIGAGTQIGAWTAGDFALDRQYVSDGMPAGVVFSDTDEFSIQLMCREFASSDNVTRRVGMVSIVSNDGSTVRTQLRAAFESTGSEFLSTGFRNVTFASGIAMSSVAGTYVTVAGDRIVVEIGYRDNAGTSPEAQANWGENATDLPEGDETQTTNGAGWIEFSNTISFGGAPRLPLLMAGR